MNVSEEKTVVSKQEYDRLVREGIREIRQDARENGEMLTMHESVCQAKALVADFYTVE